MCTIFSPQKRLEIEHLIPAPQVLHTGSRKASATPGFLHACLARHCSAPLSLCAQTPSERKPSSARYRSLITRSARVRSRSQPLFSIVPGLSSEPSSQPLGGCRCALLSRCLSCADRRTERQARLAFSRSAGLAHRLSQQSADHVSLPACPARHCSAPWSLCARAFCRIESFCRP